MMSDILEWLVDTLNDILQDIRKLLALAVFLIIVLLFLVFRGCGEKEEKPVEEKKEAPIVPVVKVIEAKRKVSVPKLDDMPKRDDAAYFPDRWTVRDTGTKMKELEKNMQQEREKHRESEPRW
jgi:hypothetical protein